MHNNNTSLHSMFAKKARVEVTFYNTIHNARALYTFLTRLNINACMIHKVYIGVNCTVQNHIHGVYSITFLIIYKYSLLCKQDTCQIESGDTLFSKLALKDQIRKRVKSEKVLNP